jgi:hypothetical protein
LLFHELKMGIQMKIIIISCLFGLSFSTISPAAQKKAADDNKEIMCTICFDPLRDGHQITAMLPCHDSHSFHIHCISKWNAQSETCPACRKKLEEGLSDATLIESLLAEGEKKEKEVRKLSSALARTKNKRKAIAAPTNSEKRLKIATQEIVRKEMVIKRLISQKKSLIKKINRHAQRSALLS